MIKIKLLTTTPTRREGQFHQVWEVQGEQFSTVAEWGDVNFLDEDKVLIPQPRVTAHDVITLALHGNGPTTDGDEVEWDERELIKDMKDGGYSD